MTRAYHNFEPGKEARFCATCGLTKLLHRKDPEAVRATFKVVKGGEQEKPELTDRELRAELFKLFP
jgi:hypothetical protein